MKSILRFHLVHVVGKLLFHKFAGFLSASSAGQRVCETCCPFSLYIVFFGIIKHDAQRNWISFSHNRVNTVANT